MSDGVHVSTRMTPVAAGSLAAMTASPRGDHSIPLVLPSDDPRAVAATATVQAGDLTELERLLAADPWLAKARDLVSRTATGRCCMRQLTGRDTFPTVRLSWSVWLLLAPM